MSMHDLYCTQPLNVKSKFSGFPAIKNDLQFVRRPCRFFPSFLKLENCDSTIFNQNCMKKNIIAMACSKNTNYTNVKAHNLLCEMFFVQICFILCLLNF